MKPITIILLSASFLLFSCHHQPKTIQTYTNLPFSLKLKQSQTHRLSTIRQLFSDEKLVPLTLTDSTTLVSVSKIVIHDSKFFVLDQKFSQLYSFDKNGKQLTKFGEVGLGPGQYKKISDFDVLNNQLAILSNNDRAINFYDVNTGKFIKRLDIDIFGSGISLISKDSILIYINQNRNNKSGDYNILLLNGQGAILDRYFPIAEENRSLSVGFSGFLSKSNNAPYYAPPFGDVVYRYQHGSFAPFVNIGINSPAVNKSSDDIKNIFKETVIRDPQTSYLGNVFLKNDNFIITTYQDSLSVNYCFYSIAKKQPYILKRSIVQDPDLLLMGNPQVLTKENDIVFNVSPETIYYLKTSLPETYNMLSPDRKRVLDKVGKNSNPVLMICKLKEL